MKPVDQVILHGGDRPGDCYRACVASLLELPAEEVPHFLELALETRPDSSHIGAWLAANEWLAPQGLALIYVRVERGVLLAPPGVLGIAAGPSPRGDFNHSVVWEVGSQGMGRIVHDPHPSRAGLDGEPIGDLELLVPLGGARLRARS